MIDENLLDRIKTKTLPMMSNWIDTEKKVNKISFSIQNEMFKRKINRQTDSDGNLIHIEKKLIISDKYLHPASEDEFEVIGVFLLYIINNPDSRFLNDVVNADGFEKMLDNIESVLG